MDPISLESPYSTRLPFELCLQVIDSLGGYMDEPIAQLEPEEFENVQRALYQCTLVCSSWWPRAKFWLFRAIRLRSLKALNSLATVLNVTPSLISLIHQMSLSCNTPEGDYSPRNVLTRLPHSLRVPLSTLRALFIGFQDEKGQSAVGNKPLPHLPLNVRELGLYHKRFASTAILHVREVTFANFADFARLLDCFDALEELECKSVTWNVLGVIPGCMTRKKKPFLPKLRKLDVRSAQVFLRSQRQLMLSIGVADRRTRH